MQSARLRVASFVLFIAPLPGLAAGGLFGTGHRAGHGPGGTIRAGRVHRFR